MHTYTIRALTEDCEIIFEETVNTELYETHKTAFAAGARLEAEGEPFSLQIINTETGDIIAESFFDN